MSRPPQPRHDLPIVALVAIAFGTAADSGSRLRRSRHRRFRRHHDAVDLLYREVRQSGPRNVIPLVMDLANLSPGQGWVGRERPAFDARRSPTWCSPLP